MPMVRSALQMRTMMVGSAHVLLQTKLMTAFTGYDDAFLIDNRGNIALWINNGGSNFSPQGQVFAGGGLGPKYVRLADVNADGNADIIVIDPASCALTAYTGNGNNGFDGAGVIWDAGKPQGCQSCSEINFVVCSHSFECHVFRGVLMCIAGLQWRWYVVI